MSPEALMLLVSDYGQARLLAAIEPDEDEVLLDRTMELYGQIADAVYSKVVSA